MMNNQENKQRKNNIWLIVILINIGVIGGGVLAVVAGLYEIWWLFYIAIIFLIIMSIVCPIIKFILIVKSSPDHVKVELKQRTSVAKEKVKNMRFKEIFIFFLVLSIFISIIVFSVLQMYVFMFICVGLFIGFGVIGGVVTTLIRKKNDRRDLN